MIKLTREEFQVYIDSFNNKDYAKATSYFADDVQLLFFTKFTNEPQEYRTVIGKEGFREHYTKLHAKVDEKLVPQVYMTDGDNIFVSIYTEFTAKEDTVFSAGPLKKGETFACTNFIIYKLDENKLFKTIRVAHYSVQLPKPNEVVLK